MAKRRPGKIPKSEDNSYNKQQIPLVSLSWLPTGINDNVDIYLYTCKKSGFLLQNQNSNPFHKISIAQEDIISVLIENPSPHIQPSNLTVPLLFI
jgi:hypothetical protein